MSDGSSSMYDLLRSEIETNAASLTDGLLNLERASASPQTIEPLMRAAHSIKGAARIVGLDAAVKVAHALEDFLVAAQAGTAALDSAKVDVLLKGVDLLKKISASADPATFALPESETQEAQCMAAAIGALGREPEIPRLILIDPPLESDEKPAAKTQAPAPAPSAPAKPKAAPRPAPTEAERIVRVNAAGMDHILGLSGELFVQSGRLEVLVLDLGRLKSAADETASLLEGAFQAAHAGDIPRAVEVLQRAKQRHERCARLLGAHRADLDAARRRILGTSGRLYQEAQSSKMCPFADCAQGFPRMVRDISRSLGKVAKLEFSGMNAGVDRDILEKLESPLTHLLRNALDHGIESPEQRINSGKQMEGVITMDAWHAAGMLVVEIADDGAGVDMARLKETIVAKKLTTAELVAKMSDFEILDFIFLPGFSTRENVTEFSGRGIGLDIVQGMIRDVGGTLRMESRPGHGTRFRLRLPLTLSVIKALIVEISGELYALPLSRASRCWRASRQKVVRVDGVRHLETDEGRFKLVAASEILDLQPAVEGACVSAVGIGEPPERYALEVDRLLGERPIAVRPLDPRLGKIRISAQPRSWTTALPSWSSMPTTLCVPRNCASRSRARPGRPAPAASKTTD